MSTALEVLLFAIACRDLPGVFAHDRFARTAPWAFVLWLAAWWLSGAFRGDLAGRATPTESARRARWERASLALVAASGLGSVRALAHLGLAARIAGASRSPLLALVSAACWLPASGRLLAPLGAAALDVLRIALAACTLAWASNAGRKPAMR